MKKKIAITKPKKDFIERKAAVNKTYDKRSSMKQRKRMYC